jgi:transcriptional regulator with XRE-family HTH domain
MAEHKTHHGRNIKRLREILGIKQEALAIELGSDWSQKKISMLEAKEEIDAPLMEQVAKALKVPVKAIEEFDEETTVNVVANTFNSNDSSTMNAVNPYCSFNPIDKVVELYERMLKDKEEMIAELKALIKK